VIHDKSKTKGYLLAGWLLMINVQPLKGDLIIRKDIITEELTQQSYL
jgi:hypothetical protein